MLFPKKQHPQYQNKIIGRLKVKGQKKLDHESTNKK